MINDRVWYLAPLHACNPIFGMSDLVKLSFPAMSVGKFNKGKVGLYTLDWKRQTKNYLHQRTR